MTLPIYFAPLQGFTESVYRRAHAIYAGGVAAYYAPFLRVEKGGARQKDFDDLLKDYGNDAYPVVAQVIAKDSSEFATLVDELLEHGIHKIDLNMGCPYPMQTKSGRGAGILTCPGKVKEILDKIQEYESQHIDGLEFSAKMRLGNESPEECLALAPMLNETPLTRVVLHPRLGIQQYKGAVDMAAFARFHDLCTIPLVYNGDLATVGDLKNLEAKFPKLAGFMIGRGLLANPNLANEYAGVKSCGHVLGSLIKIHGAILEEYRNRLQGPAQVLDKIRPFWTYVELPKKVAKKIEKARTLSDYESAVKELDLLA